MLAKMFILFDPGIIHATFLLVPFFFYTEKQMYCNNNKIAKMRTFLNIFLFSKGAEHVKNHQRNCFLWKKKDKKWRRIPLFRLVGFLAVELAPE